MTGSGAEEGTSRAQEVGTSTAPDGFGCETCGALLSPDAAFCTACAAPRRTSDAADRTAVRGSTPSAPPVPSPAPAAGPATFQPTAPFASRHKRRWWTTTLISAGIAIAATAGFAGAYLVVSRLTG
ncbi:hypothetical protein [Nocardioides sp. AE5]|uniref:hypothetical protein n=1 Tax=Nocardioides sp. AE5 TaxID=2962573 RepID=UPI0028821C42|nr:hypothetical protein [Nocardioides sp. AE5]MDT0200416.1 hypothetical protein [Nocardioides sp. AE5]